MLAQLGEGTFGRVVECFDRERPDWNRDRFLDGGNDHPVAVKVIKNIPKYRDAAMIELRVLKVSEPHPPPLYYTTSMSPQY